jgi:REP element-mobilizing transposase RayT
MIRGIERRAIFKDDQDRKNFLERLERLFLETKTLCYAWALMPNHAHFLLRSGPSGISQLMRRLLTGHAVFFNRRHRRHGQLFQNRYKSIICQEDIYLKELVGYVHLNPVRARMVDDLKGLNNYPYTGHSALMNKIKREWQDTEYVLACFGNSRKAARQSYASFIEAGWNQGRNPELTGGGLIRSIGGWTALKNLRLKGQDRLKGDERILGDSEFVLSILAEADEKYDRQYELKSRGYDLKQVQMRVSELLGVDGELIYSKGRRRDQVEARSLFCYWAVRELGYSATEMARRLGMNQPAVGYAVSRGEKMAKALEISLL